MSVAYIAGLDQVIVPSHSPPLHVQLSKSVDTKMAMTRALVGGSLIPVLGLGVTA